MNPEKDYIQINRDNWNKRTAVHLDSDFYDVKGFINGKCSLNQIEIDLLQDIQGKQVLHLQCHFGQDSISLARMGAEVTGVDLSDEAIKQARLLSKKTKQSVDFICCDIYDLPNHLDKKFDIVYTSYGVIGWLPDMDRWAHLINTYLNEGGKLIFVEFHPVVWMFDDDFKAVDYNYFNEKAIVETLDGTYTDSTNDLQTENITWNHSIAEVLTALLKQGLELTSFSEYDYSPYNCFKNTVEFALGKYRIAHLENKIPMVYALTCLKS